MNKNKQNLFSGKCGVSRRTLWLLIVWCCLAMPTMAASLHPASTMPCEEDECMVIESLNGRVPATRAAVPDVELPSAAALVNLGHIYVFRLAIAISPNSFQHDFHGSREEVRQWWNEMEKYLESVYRNAVGLRFEVVRDERLIMQNNTTGFDLQLSNGTNLLNKLIGKDQYEAGVLIKHKEEIGGNGAALLRGASSNHTKGSAQAIKNPSTVAHEVGHLFGAVHTHQKEDANYTEPGFGQSIMGYGENRTSFSLVSIINMRNILSNMGYYTRSDRSADSFVAKEGGQNENVGYIEKETAEKPLLNGTKLRREYQITEGTYFQFHLSAKNARKEGLLYWVNPYDVVNRYQEPNALQPAYAPTTSANVMFQPYYEKPPMVIYVDSPKPVAYSDQFRPGVYRFLTAVSSGSYFDTKEVSVRIVGGSSFRIKPTVREGNTGGDKLTLEWHPCRELYGEDSKVRILLSTDFGQTFPYILADDVPNTGSWQGAWPYIFVGKTKYKDFPEEIYGGMLKVEVKGEAAFDIYPRTPYIYENRKAVYTGGFSIDDYDSRIKFSNPPTPFVTLESKDKLPEMATLRARHDRDAGRWYNVQGKDSHEGRIVRRTWTANILGIERTYTQIFLLPEVEDGREKLVNEAKDLLLSALPLYLHGGELGYPKPDAPAYQEFRKAYKNVFDDDNKVKEEVAETQLSYLKTALEALAKMDGKELVQPRTGQYYRLRNYHNIFGRPRYWYVGKGTAGEYWTNEEAEAVSWKAEKVGNDYRFTDEEGQSVMLNDFNYSRSAIRLDRGYSWGSFTLVNSIGRSVQLNQKGTTLSVVDEYMNNPLAYRVNNNGMPISTDFQWVLDETKTATSIQTIGRHTHEPAVIYDLMGRKCTEMGSGVYIIRQSDGSVKKVKR
ncbi:MAG: M12 family metallo-peptidase [Prevotellaceae bacterium]|nr:M12 family metallo-peptidase [Prevotellaceae bacterium]MDY3365664.1 M12 family metallo-peptidase [Prevotella sp.]